MMSPRSFLYSRTSTSRPKPPPSPSPSSPSRTPSNSNSTTPTSSPPSHITSSSSLSSLTHSLARPKSASASLAKPPQPPAATTKTPTPTPWFAKHEESRLDTTTVTVTPLRSAATAISATAQTLHADMGKRKDRRGAASLAPSSPPSTTTSTSTAVMTRPTTPTSPVQIPKHANRETAHPPKRHHSAHHGAGHRRHPRDMHTPDSISPSVAALLAVTDIPRQRQRRRRRSDKPMTLGDFIDGQHVSEKELSWSLGRSPMDMLLSPPEELMDDDLSISGSAMSTRTVSVDSIPSLGDSFATDLASSLDTPGSPSPSLRRRGPSPMRKSLEPVRSPPGAADEHPLAAQRVNLDLEEADFSMLRPQADAVAKSQLLQPFKPLKSVFRSNLTASLRALRSAAKSFSSINFPTLPADDFLTRSMLTIDPNVPYTDERRPPVTEEMPSAELRRYLNPTTSSRIDTPPAAGAPPPGKFSASIQMQTYKVHRSRSAPPASRGGSTSSSTTTQSPQSGPYQPQPQSPSQTAFSYPPGMRQREMRENSDFIRIAVMEMAMRKRGKLDDQKPGRARWALPPRKMCDKEYEIGANGVPARWTPVSY